MPSYDIIGDIHGQADKLVQLLDDLGYVEIGGVYQYRAEDPPTNKVVFVGDLIDGNPGNRRVLEIVRPMVEHGHALAVMGNHEFNAICFHTPHPETGRPLRHHSGKNIAQHAEFLKEFPPGEAKTQGVIAWFRTLPLFLEIDTGAGLSVREVDEESDQPQHRQVSDRVRIVHACWAQRWIDWVTIRLGSQAIMDDDFLIDAAQHGTEAFHAVEMLLKGAEIRLPDGVSFIDAHGDERRNIRFCWWRSGTTYRDIALIPRSEHDPIPDLPLPDALRKDVRNACYPDDAPPVFFGHYWLSGEPQAQRHNVACLDYSAGKGGPLVVYRWFAGGSQPGAGRLRGDRFASSADVDRNEQ